MSGLLPLLICEIPLALLPPVETHALKDRVACIARFLGVEINPELPLPTVHVLEAHEIMTINPQWLNSCDTFWGTYRHAWPRVFLGPESRQDFLYHELVHYVQFAYNRVPNAESEMERQACEGAELLMLIYHPVRYQLLMMTFGIFGWRASDP